MTRTPSITRPPSFTRPLVRLGLAATAALLALTGLTACGQKAEDTTDVTWDGQALMAIGYTTEEVTPAEPQPAATDRTDRRNRHPRLRYAFRHTLHGEATVQTEEGSKVVVVQRGTVTAVGGGSITVKSTDGFTLTWTLGSEIKVIANRAKADISAVTVGVDVGIAGAKQTDSPTARLIIIPKKP